MNESKKPTRPKAEHILDSERKPSLRRIRRSKTRGEKKIGTRTHREGGREGGEEISLPACSAESSQQVRAWSLAAAAVGSSRSSWLEALLCPFCCGMFSTYYPQVTSFAPALYMQINVRPMGSVSSEHIPGSPSLLGAVPCRLCGFMLIQVEDSFLIWLHSAFSRGDTLMWRLQVGAYCGYFTFFIIFFYWEQKNKIKKDLLLCRFMLIQVACLMENTFIMWLHSGAES